MGILSARGGWDVFFAGGGDEGRKAVDVVGVVVAGFTSELVPNSPQLSLAERCICEVNMWGADENMNHQRR